MIKYSTLYIIQGIDSCNITTDSCERACFWDSLKMCMLIVLYSRKVEIASLGLQFVDTFFSVFDDDYND